MTENDEHIENSKTGRWNSKEIHRRQTQRRVRRISTGQKTDAFLGSDIMIEDILGYNGRIKDMEWKLLGSDELLLPMYAHNQLDLSQKMFTPLICDKWVVESVPATVS